MSYIYDPDLEFLGSRFIKDEDLEPLFLHLKNRISEEFCNYKCYQKYKHTKKHKLYWKAIAGEFQKFGGNTIANKFRGHGVKYRKIAYDVAKKLKVKVYETEDIKSIEEKIIEKLFYKIIDKMSKEEKEKFIKEFHKEFEKLSKKEKEKILKNKDLKRLLNSQINAKNALTLFRMIFKAGGFKSYQISVIIINSIYNSTIRMLTDKGLPLIINRTITKNLALFVGPIGTIISTLWTIYDITGPAYRVTVPGVVMIAMLRKEEEERKLEEKRRLEEQKRQEELKKQQELKKLQQKLIIGISALFLLIILFNITR